MLYRVLKSLTTGQEPGDWVRGDRFKSKVVEALVENGAISPVRGPPLATLGGWTVRAEKLLKVGIVNATDFLAADDTAIMLAFGHKTNRAVNKYRNELMELLGMKMPPQRTRRLGK